MVRERGGQGPSRVRIPMNIDQRWGNVIGPEIIMYMLRCRRSHVGKIEKGISVIATGDGLIWADHSSQENILAYYQIRSPIAQLLVCMASADNFSRENIS